MDVVMKSDSICKILLVKKRINMKCDSRISISDYGYYECELDKNEFNDVNIE